jgi:hypothetical protein
MPLTMIDSTFRVPVKRITCPVIMLIKPVFQKVQGSFLEPRLIKILEMAEAQLAIQPFFCRRQYHRG